jgi:Rod binding domain-containing protein
MNPLAPLTAGNAEAAAEAARESQKPDAARQKADAQLDKVAQEFEAIFVRKVLGELQKTTKLSGQAKIPGADMYESIWLNEVSNSLAKSGGFGVGRMLKETLARQGKSPEQAIAEMKGALAKNGHEELEAQARNSKVPGAGAVPSLREGFPRSR